jgi:hypothetical protein
VCWQRCDQCAYYSGLSRSAHFATDYRGTLGFAVVARYYFVISRTEEIPATWKWTIQRKNKPLLVRLEGDGFRSKLDATLAGEKALEKLMIALAENEKEEARERRQRRRPRLVITVGID